MDGELCGHCAGKIQDRINKIDGVNDAKVNFMTMRFTLDADEARWDDIVAVGASLVVKAIASGRKVAECVHQMLTEEKD